MRRIFVTFLILGFAGSAQASTWAKRGTSFPARCFSDSLKECQLLRVLSPDHKSAVEVSYEKILLTDGDFVVSVVLQAIAQDGTKHRFGARGLVEQEIAWSPDSTSVFINGSDGGEGPDYVSVYRIGDAEARLLNVIAAQKDMMKSFPPCKAKNADAEICAAFEKVPEEINVSGIDWTGGADAIVVMAEMPCSSAFGGILCQVLGYEVEVASGKVMRRMEAKEFARRWQKSMAFKLHVPGPPEYETTPKK